MRLLGKFVLSISLGIIVFSCGGENKESLDSASQEGSENSSAINSEAVPTESANPTVAILTESSEPTQVPTPKQPPTPLPAATPTPAPELPPTPQQTPTTVEAPLANELSTQLDTLTIEPESEEPYDRSDFPHWDDEDGDGKNTRDDILDIAINEGRCYSRWDAVWEYSEKECRDGRKVQIDHIVSLNEAWDSGASKWDPYDRDIFADDILNLVAVSASSNRSKGARDAGEWLPPDPDGRCFLAIRVIQVKSKWELSVDQVEYEALRNLIENCGSNIPQIPSPPEASVTPTSIPSTPTPSSPTPTPISAAPTPITSAPTPTPQSSYGNSYYATANGVDIDQYDENGNGDINCGELPSAAKPVTLLNAAEDPYGLDGDGDGIGCES